MFLIDTNVISELRKARTGRVSENVALWAESNHAEEMYISVITVQELETGVQLIERKDDHQGRLLRNWLNDQVIRNFQNRILPVDITIAQKCAELHVPNPRPASDMLRAATALVHNLTLVTRNVKDFENTDIKIINPWD